MMITTMPIVLRMQVQGGGGRRCCLPRQSRRNVSILSTPSTTMTASSLSNSQKVRKTMLIIVPGIETDNGENTQSAILI